MKNLLPAFFLQLIVSAALAQTTEVNQLTGNSIETAKGIITDHSGNVITWGTFIGTMDFDPGTGVANVTAVSEVNDGYVAKYNANGNFLWVKTYGGTNSYTAINAVDADQFDNLYVSGAFTGTIDADPSTNISSITSAGDVDFFINKLTSSGNFLWNRHFGGTGADQADDIKTNEINAFYISGVFSNTVDFDPSGGTFNLTTSNPGTPSEENRSFIAKYNLDGNVIWAERLGGRGGKVMVNKNAPGNDYIIFSGGGTAFSTTLDDFDPSQNTVSPVPPPLPGANYAVIAKYDPDGKFIWADFFRTFFSMNASAGPGIARVIQDADKNLYFGGAYVQSFTAYPQNILSLTPIGTVYTDAMLVKLNSNGALIWEKKIGAANAYDYIGDLTFDINGNIITAGSFGGFGNNAVADFNIPGTPATLSSNGNYDGFVAAYNQDGAFLYNGKTGGTGSDYMAGVAVADGKNWLFGGFEVQADADPFAGITTLSANGTTDLFLDAYLTAAEQECSVPASLFTSNITMSTAQVNWSGVAAANKYKVSYKESIAGTWTNISSANTLKKLKNLAPATAYDWRVRSICSVAGLGNSKWSPVQHFTTLPQKIQADKLIENSLLVFPNPVSSSAIIRVVMEEPTEMRLELFSPDGRSVLLIADENVMAGSYQFAFDVVSLPAGMYFLQMKSNSVNEVIRVAVQ